MAELLVRTADKVHPDDPALDRMLLKRGDVVVICPDGHPWSETERTNPEWRIIRVLGVSPEKLSHLVLGDNETIPENDRRRRLFSLDLDMAEDQMKENEVRSIEKSKPPRHRGVVEL